MAVVQGGGIAGTCPGTTPVAGCTMMVGCSSGMAGASGVLVDQQGTVGSQEVCQQMEVVLLGNCILSQFPILLWND